MSDDEICVLCGDQLLPEDDTVPCQGGRAHKRCLQSETGNKHITAVLDKDDR